VAETSAKGDPEWVPSPVMRRRVKHKYSSRTTGNQVHKKNFEESHLPCSLPGEVTVATPIITQKARPYATAQEAAGDIIAPDQDHGSGVHAAEGRKRRKLENHSSRICELDPVPIDMRQKLKKVVTPSRWMLIDGLYNGLDALLKGTEKSTRPQNCGARSLFSVCLRRVPDYIAAEQSWHESQDDDDDVDVCSEVYNHLENMGSTSGEGWKPLREVVRAHGVAMLGDAIREGLIDHIVGRGLVFLCIHALAFDEAEDLLDSSISSLDVVSRPSSVYSKLFDSNATACLGTLDVFASRSGCHGFQFRQLERLLRTRLLPIEWVATTEFAPTWGRVVQSISHGDQDYSDAAQLLITAVMLACGLADRSASSSTQKDRLTGCKGKRGSIAEPAMPFTDRLTKTGDADAGLSSADAGLSSALNNTISSLMAIMYAISITQRDKTQEEHLFKLPGSNKSACALLERLNLEILRKLDLTCRFSSNDIISTIYRRRTVTVFLVLLLVAQEWQGYQPGFLEPRSSRILDNIAALTILCEHNEPETASQVANVVLSVARCCAKASPGQEFDHLQKLTNRLASIASDKAISNEPRQLFACFALTTAKDYAQDTGNHWHIEWALEVEERVMKDSHVSVRNFAKTPHKSDGDPPEGYRWEEGICEWIARTPKITNEEPSASHELSDLFSKDYRQPCPQLHREAPPVNSKASTIRSEDTSHVISTRGSKRAANSLAKQDGTHIFTTQHANTAGRILRILPQLRTDGQARSLRTDIPDAGPNGSWKLHADKHEDELAAFDSFGEQSKSRGWKRGITVLASARLSQSRGSRQALRRSKCQPLRFQPALRQPMVVGVALEDESEDELGM